MLRGEIHWVDLDPALGCEADNMRPAVIVSNDGANTTAARLGHGVVTVVPITTSIDRIYPFQVLLPAAETGLDRDSKAQAEQVRAFFLVVRVRDRIGSIPAPRMLEVNDALRLHLAP